MKNQYAQQFVTICSLGIIGLLFIPVGFFSCLISAVWSIADKILLYMDKKGRD